MLVTISGFKRSIAKEIYIDEQIQDVIMRLIKEQADLEDEEIVRHKENLRKKGASLSSDDEDEEDMTEGEDNGLRVFGKDMIVKIGQKHGKRHRAFAFVYDFLHSIIDHRSEVKLSSNG
nr:hypothetical protein [Tanacetum cinerariifolium]